MKIPFSIAEVRSLASQDRGSVKALVDFADQSYADGAYHNPVTSRMVVEVKALTYVTMFGTLERTIRRSCISFGEHFKGLTYEEDLATFPFMFSILRKEICDITGIPGDQLRASGLFIDPKKSSILQDIERKLIEAYPSPAELWQRAFQTNDSEFDPDFAGFFDLNCIRAYCNFYQIGEDWLEGEGCRAENEQLIQRVRRTRNRVAHGESSLKEIGRQITSEALKRDSKKWFQLVNSLLNSIENAGSQLETYYRV